MRPVFVQLRCAPGQTYAVADAIYDREIVSELYSTSGEYDLLAKVYIPEGEDVGRWLNEKLFGI
ncbi:MAG: Lrp/AsnC ligand binding domain-containing protein [Paracoccus sp. (in: a-proteobacteria)]